MGEIFPFKNDYDFKRVKEFSPPSAEFRVGGPYRERGVAYTLFYIII